jgi:hypothetical protein
MHCEKVASVLNCDYSNNNNNNDNIYWLQAIHTGESKSPQI